MSPQIFRLPSKEAEGIEPPQGDFKEWFYGNLADRISPADPKVAERRQQASEHLIDFIRYTFPSYIADPFHIHLASEVQKVVDGGVKRIMLFAPPQHGKSQQVSIHLPPFWLAHNPDLPVALTSYAANLAYRNSRFAREIIRSPQYAEVFPGIREDTQNSRVYEWHIKGYKAFVKAAGVGGPLTGFGFGLGIIDDPHKNWEEAQSERKRDAVYDWYLGTFLGRMWESGVILLMATRWHEDDLPGRILKNEGRVEEGGAWKILPYSALADAEAPEKDIIGREFGEALSPSRFSETYLKKMEQTVGPYIWSAEYQQKPTKPSGSFFKIGRIEIVEAVPAEVAVVNKEGQIETVKKGVRFWDLAATAKARDKRDPDSTSGTLMAEHTDIFYWLDTVNERLEPEQVEELILLTAKVDGRPVKQRMEQEPGASGKSLIARFLRLLKGFDFAGRPSGGDKPVKATPLAAQVNGGNVRMLAGPWNKRVLAQLAVFDKGSHDDDVDSGAGAFNTLTEQVEKFKDISFQKV